MLTTMSNLPCDIWWETRFFYCQPYTRIYKFTMDLIPNDWKHLLKTESSWKILFKALYLYKGTRKKKSSKNSLIKKSTSPFNLIVLNNTTNLWNSFYGQTSLNDTIFSVKKALMDICFLSGVNLFIFLFSSLQYTQNGQHSKDSVSQHRCREQE